VAETDTLFLSGIMTINSIPTVGKEISTSTTKNIAVMLEN